MTVLINMFKTKNKLLPLALTPHGKLKQKILHIAVAMLFPSLLLIDVINVRTASHEDGLTIFIKNIHLMAPWGLAYLIAARHRDLLKIFAPLYMSLILLATTGSLAFNHFSQSNGMEEKFAKETAHIMTDYAAFLADTESSPQKPSQLYSADEYGHFAVHLNKFKKRIEGFKQENRAIAHAFNKLELDKIFTDEVLFNFLNIIEKKKELEKLSPFLDETAKRIEDIHSECLTWAASSPEIKGDFLKGFAKGLFKSSEENKFLRQESYRIKKSIVQEYIKLLDFLSKAYGSYGRGTDGQIVLANDSDLQTFRSHCEILEKLFKEEETSLLALQEGSRLMTKPSSPLMNEPKSDPLDQILTSFRQRLVDMDQAFAEVDLNNIFTEEMLFDLAKIQEKKKKLGQLCVVLDTTEKNLEEQLSGLVKQILSSMQLSDQVRKKVEIFNETIPAATKRWMDIKRKYVLEFIKLLDFLSMRYGTYKLNENHGLYFSYEIETKVCESYLNNIKKFYKEEEETAALVQQCTQGLSK